MPRTLLTIMMFALLLPTLVQSGPYGPNKELHMVERQHPMRPIGQFRLRFKSYQPQGLVKHNELFYLSSLEIIKRKGHENVLFKKDSRQDKRAHGRAHLFVFDRNGILHKDVHLSMGTLCHPGGMSHDGEHLWVPVSESWQYGHSMMLRVNMKTLNVQRVFTFDDHLAGVVVDKKRERLFTWNWSSESWYVFTLEGRLLHKQPDPIRLFDVQDAKLLPSGEILASGARHNMGGIAVLSPQFRLRHFLYIPEKTPEGRAISENPMDYEWKRGKFHLFFAPDDNRTHLAMFRLASEKLPVSRWHRLYEHGLKGKTE